MKLLCNSILYVKTPTKDKLLPLKHGEEKKGKVRTGKLKKENKVKEK